METSLPRSTVDWSGDAAGAVARFEEALTRARASRDGNAISLLARHVAVVCSHASKPEKAAEYYEEAIGGAPEDSWLRLAVADIYREIGHEDLARRSLEAALQLANRHGDQDVLDILRGTS